MNHRFPTSFKRLVPPGLALLAAAVLFAPSTAQATPTPYVVKFAQEGNNVVATGSGEFDLTGLFYEYLLGGEIYVWPKYGDVVTGADLSGSYVYGLPHSGPMSFGSGRFYEATISFHTGTGGVTGLDSGSFSGTVPSLLVPYGYRSGAAISSSAVWDDASFASLGMTPGIYRWTWGSAADQSFTLMIGTVPEPAVLGMFGLGLLLLGGFATLRRREPPQIG